MKEFIQLGASPRATIALTLAAKAYAFLKGRGYVTPQDVKSIGMDVLRHRVAITYEAEAEEKTSETIIQKIFDESARAMIPREILRKIRQIEIRTNRLVSETLAGQYHSVFKGQGMNFDEVREYQPGDEVRSIDWNVTARMNHPFVKKFVEERELTRDAGGGCERFGLVRFARLNPSASWRRRLLRCSRSPPSATTTRSA